MRMTSPANFCIKMWGSSWFYLFAEPERCDTMIICESMRIKHELNTNWYDAVRCNKMQYHGDTMQYEAVRWWWRINTIALRCNENTIWTNRNLHEPNMCDPVRQCDRCASYCNVLSRSRQAANTSANVFITNRYECLTMRYEPIGTDMSWYDVRRCNRMQYE